MFDKSTDRNWESFGLTDPYFGVLTDERFKSINLTPEAKLAFFKSGEEDIERAFFFIRKHIHPEFNPKKVLDFGCGVGRLMIPLAHRCESVIGMDVSDAMLKEAQKNCLDNSITNVTFLKSDDCLSNLTGTYDFIHSYIVFQHIPISRGETILFGLIDHLAKNGLCALHFTYSTRMEPSSIRKIIRKITKRIPYYYLLRKTFLGLPLKDPEMQMNCYNVTHLFKIIQLKGINNIHAQLMSHGKYFGLFLFFKKDS